MWHEARRSEKKVHDMMDAARKRAQRRAVFLAKRRGDPQQAIQLTGSHCRTYRDDGLYHATQDHQGLIPWNGREDVLIDRFDGRALLDFIREPGSRHFRAQEKSKEDEELEEFVNFERYRDLISIDAEDVVTDDEGLQHVNQEMEAKATAPFASERSQLSQPPASKGSYSQVAFSYEGVGKEEAHFSDGDEDDFNSDDSNDEGMDMISKEFGVKRYGWLVYMDKKAKEEEKRQKEVIKGDPAIRKLSRKDRRKASQMEREKDREVARVTGTHVFHRDPYRHREPKRSPTYEAYPRSRRSRSRLYSPSYSRRHSRGGYSDDIHRRKSPTQKIEYITEFGGSGEGKGQKLEGYSPPPSPSQADVLNRPSSGCILEALHVDPASGVSLDKEKNPLKPSSSSSSALAKLTKTATSGEFLKPQHGEKKETPQERLKRIMSRQLNKQIKEDTAADMTKKREQERQRLEKLAETSQQVDIGAVAAAGAVVVLLQGDTGTAEVLVEALLENTTPVRVRVRVHAPDLVLVPVLDPTPALIPVHRGSGVDQDTEDCCDHDIQVVFFIRINVSVTALHFHYNVHLFCCGKKTIIAVLCYTHWLHCIVYVVYKYLDKFTMIKMEDVVF